MKKLIFTSTFMLCCLFAFSQVPHKFNYQAVARNAQGSILPNQSVSIRSSVLDGSPTGLSQYSEAHNVTTNQLGLITLAIGDGTILSGSFSNIAWASGDKYLKIEMDATGGNNYTLVGVSQLLSVPYAVYADKVNIQEGNGISISNNTISNTGDLDNTNELQSLSLNGNTLQISNGNQVILPTSPVYTGGSGIQINGTTITNTGDSDNSFTNELQTLSVSGNLLQISGGNGVTLPEAPVYTPGQGIQMHGSTISNTGDNDSSPTNELQTLSVSGNLLQISGGNGVTLPTTPSYTAGQGIQINGTTINNSGDNDSSPTNELQQISLTGNVVALSNGGNITLPTPVAGNGITLNGWQITNNGDLSNTNELQTLTLSGNSLSLSQNGGSVTLPSSGTSQWTTTGSNIYYNTGNVGIGTTSPAEKLHLRGKMKIDSTFTMEFGAGLGGKQIDAGKIGYQAFSTDALDIIGAGTSSTTRKIKFYNEGGADFTGNIRTSGKVIGLSSANFPLGVTQELGPSTPILHLDMNFRHPNNNTTYLGAAFRIDSRISTGPLFQWLYRPSKSTTESFPMTLDHLGNAVFAGGLTTPVIKITTGAASGKVLTSDASGNATWQTPTGGGSSQWATITGGIQYNSGKVLIGNVSSPGNYKLYVEQGILTERVKVALKSTSYWADYVFEPSYKLMPLSDVELFIKENKHLPNVPSAEDVVNEGIDMATMDSKLLEKIEELTLYMIEMKKENEMLKERISKLENSSKQ